MSTHYNHEFEFEHKNKAIKLAEKIKGRFNSLHKIEFRANGKYHAVLLTEGQLAVAERKSLKKGVDIKEYYIEKYTA